MLLTTLFFNSIEKFIHTAGNIFRRIQLFNLQEQTFGLSVVTERVVTARQFGLVSGIVRLVVTQPFKDENGLIRMAGLHGAETIEEIETLIAFVICSAI